MFSVTSATVRRLEELCHKNNAARKKAGQYMILKAAQRYPISAELVMKCAAGSTGIFEEHIMHALVECGITQDFHGDIYNELFSRSESQPVQN